MTEVYPQRLQNEIEKIIDGAAFNEHHLCVAHDRLVAPTYRLPALAKNPAQLVCKNSIGAIVLPANLPLCLNGHEG